MNIGILGTGAVGKTIGSKLAGLGHSVMMGSRTRTNEKALAWKEQTGELASVGTFADAAKHGEILFNCTSGTVSLDVLALARTENLSSKILIDISNPLDFSKGMPPTLSVCNTDSVGEQIQRTYPTLKVVKSLNTCNCAIMVNPSLLPGEHDVFVGGDDADAKAQVTDILTNWFGWKNVIDLGGIQSSRAVEMLMPFWLSMWGVNGNANFNYHITR
jgi:predicted dinucleotide-binding enzyme